MVLMLEKNKNILDTTLLNVTKVVKELTEVKKAGFVEDSDVDQLRLTESNMKSAISTIVRQIEVVNNLLKMQIGIPVEQQIILTDKLDELLLKADITGQSSAEFNAKNNIGYQMLETQEKLVKLNLKRYQAQCLPTVVAFFRHQEMDKEPAFNFNPKNVLGISMDIPIFASGMRHAKQQQVKLELEKITNSKENVSKALTVEYTQALAAYNNAKDKYSNEKQNVDLAKRIATNTLKKYRNGIATSLDLATTQTQSLQVQITLTQAVFELLSAKNKLEKVLSSGAK
jgi:outer membrane protein TolC